GPLLLRPRHPRRRLVEQEEPRLLDEQHRDLEPLLLAVRERARQVAGALAQSDLVEHRDDRVVRVEAPARAERGGEALPTRRQEHVLEDRVPREDRRRRSEEHTSELQSLAYLVCR